MREPDGGISRSTESHVFSFCKAQYTKCRIRGLYRRKRYDLRMRKTKLLLLVALLLGVGVAKAEVTTDKVVISDLTLEPGGNQAYFTISLEGSDVLYSAYDISLVIPEGLEVVYKDGFPYVQMFKGASGMYPYVTEEDPFEGTSTTTYTHTLASNIIDGNVLRIMCYSTKSESLRSTSGRLCGVFVKASPYMKPGDIAIAIKDVYLTTSAAVQYEPEDYVSTAVQAAATSTLTLKVSDTNKYGTCILPFDYALPADGSLEAYTCSSYTDDALVLEKATAIAAYIPYILYSENGFSATISGTVDAAKYPAGGTVKSGHLVGTLVQTELTEGCYVMQNQGDGPMFYRVGAVPFALSAGKCYVELPEGTNVASLRIGGSTTGLESIHNSEFIIQNCIYNLLGQPVTHMLPGRVYIVDGRKVVAK